ncbi:hypothetical protein ASPZODRAFT_99985 [Penicilliopsis zonata CBS 506.65]|uniref:tRNA-splicing endonuclease subunit Sen54 N-terminal domain-containing protein n=1 Tax=Penicilliopsis zonata CBS 506.65 TaxID=1073090 RepID=A0A1L9SCK2_9EURO|nr:hypothetical protein ASPZODRAFT_99985 [Penicilliopsis zonata CBS 506.65]OJJ44940.1 hypothetical protein ASPZODRAFT_99985 [Penicilliopsis zonata CBS 506.65]
MADVDEEAIHLPDSQDSSGQIEVDLSDETQDFRFLSLLSDNTQATLPRRGEKDFEPNPTLYQADGLTASRQAMHNALAYPRLHNPKNKIIAVYAPDGPAPPASVLASKDSSKSDDTHKTLDAAAAAATNIGVSPHACVYALNPKGQYFRTMGQADRWNRVWLLPEEALYLLERGNLEIWWPLSSTSCADDNNQGELGVPMSLQAAYSCLMGRGGLTMERFSVFTGLKRLGYTLLRAPGWDEAPEPEKEGEDLQKDVVNESSNSGPSGLFGWLFQWITDSHSKSINPATGPLIGLGIHRSYREPSLITIPVDIYRRLDLIPWYDPAARKAPAEPTKPPFRVVFHVYKPSTPFRKTAPPEPDFRIAVIDARAQTTLPTLLQLGALLESTPLDPPRGEKMERMLYMRLRHGYRNVILAVVDQGVVSYLRIGDAAFGKEKMYKSKAGLSGPKTGGYSRSKPKAR